MKLQFIGANHEVTGSCHYLQAGDSYMLVDYEMEQGVNRFENCPLPVPESQINFVFLTHAHIDHSGMLPLLYAHGFRGKIYTTEATADLCSIMLRDCAHIEEENIVIEVNGIGYNVRIPAGMAGRLPQIGEVVKLYTYTSVREDAIGLYGFLSRDDLNMYRQLITVSGIGPKGGLSVLSAMSADELRMAVISQDAKAIAKAPGVGIKTAQRIILELKDKISLEDTAMMREVNQVPQGSMLTGKSQAQTEAVEALTALGYSPSEALRAVKAVLQETPDLDVEALLKAALKKMF